MRLNEVVEGKRGVVTYGWETIDLMDDAIVNPFIEWGSSSTEDSKSVASTNRSRPLSNSDGKA